MSTAKFNLVLGSSQLVDVMFLADATGSMGPCLANVKSNMITALRDFRTSTKWNVGVGVSFYRDNMDSIPFRVLQTITTDTNAITTAVNNLAAMGGGDTPEGQLAALSLVAPKTNGSGWRNGAIRIVAWFGDQPGHDPYTLNKLTYTIASPTPPHDINPIATLQEYAVNVCAFSMNTGPGGNQLDATGQATAITKQCDYDGNAHVKLNVSITNVAKTIFDYLTGVV